MRILTEQTIEQLGQPERRSSPQRPTRINQTMPGGSQIKRGSQLSLSRSRIGRIDRPSRGSIDQIEAVDQPQRFQRGAHTARNRARHPAALDRQRDTSIITPGTRSTSIQRPVHNQPQHRILRRARQR
jgi:hypothetical protein